MSLELLNEIRSAEDKAENAKLEAQRQAREIIKAVETACAASERNAAVDHRTLYQQLMEKRRQAVEAKLADERAGTETRVKADMEAAAKHLDQAADLIFERVVTHGDR